MSQATRQSFPSVFRNKLSSLRMKIFSWLFLEGISRVLPTILGLLVLMFLIDWNVEMDVPQRVIFMVLSVGAVLTVGYFKLVRPFFKHLSDDALILEVEKQNRSLRESLISAVQFSRDVDAQHQGVSLAMIEATIAKGTESADAVNFGTALNAKRFTANIWISGLTVVLLGLFCYGLFNNDTMNIFFQRMMFNENAEYAKKTYLEFYDPEGRIQDNTLTIYKGEHCPLLVHVREDSEITDVEVHLRYREKGGSWEKHDTKRTKRFSGREHEKVYKSVSVGFEVEARGGDGKSKRLQIKLEEPPQFSNIAAEVFYPDYAVDVRPDDLIRVFDREQVYRYLGPEPGSSDSWELIDDVTDNGKKLVEWGLIDNEQLTTLVEEFEGQTEKSMMAIARRLDFFTEQEFADTLKEKLNIQSVRSDAERNWLRDPSEVIADFGSELSVLEGSSIKLTATGNTQMKVAQLVHSQSTRDFTTEDGETYELTIPAEELIGGSYQINLRDETMREPPRQSSFAISIAADKTPEVKATLKGVSGLIVNRAKIPFTVAINDDYKIVDIYVVYSWQEDLGKVKADTKVMIDEYEPTKSWDSERPPIAKKVSQILPAGAIKLTEQFLDLDALPNDDKVPEHARLSVRVFAVDNDNVNGPNIGESKEFPIRVVPEEELRADLLRREREARQEFDQIYKTQLATRDETEVLSADAKTDDETEKAFQYEMTSQLTKLIREQKIIGENVEKVIDRMNDLLTEAMNNRLDESTGEFESRYTDKIIGPMQTLTDEMIFELKLKLDESRVALADDAQRAKLLTEAVEMQNNILAEMEKILLEMEKSEDLQAIINKVFEAMKKEKELRDQVEKERKKRIKSAGNSEDEKAPEKSDTPSEDKADSKSKDPAK